MLKLQPPRLEVRCRWHIAAGIITVWSALGSMAFPFVVALGYLYYQRQQDRNLGSSSYLDIYEWLVVVCINVAAFVPLKVMGLI